MVEAWRSVSIRIRPMAAYAQVQIPQYLRRYDRPVSLCAKTCVNICPDRCLHTERSHRLETDSINVSRRERVA